MNGTLKRELYALTVLTIMACRPGQTVRVAELARREGLPPRVLQRIFQALRAGGMVRSERGRLGGFQLAAPLSEISVARVFDALAEPPLRHSIAKFGVAGSVVGAALEDLRRKRRTLESRLTLQDLRDAAARQGAFTNELDFVI